MSIKPILLTTFFLIFLFGCQQQSSSPPDTDNSITTSSESLQTNLDLNETSNEEKELIKKTETTSYSRNYDSYRSVNDLVNDLIKDYNYPPSRLGIAYYNFVTKESYFLNENIGQYAASTNKVGTAVLYIQLIEEGKLNWQSKLPASSDDFASGAGKITNNPIQSEYELEELIENLLVYSDNTAWKILMNYYQNNFGDFNLNLIEKSGASQKPDSLYNQYNYATPNTLLGYLKQIAKEKKYLPLIKYMSKSEKNQRFKLYIRGGMATKYGQYDYSYHDTGIYYENGRPIYALVLMTDGIGTVDQFMGELNLIINEWSHFQMSSH
ncbi:class A beta-lactamase-related serine hydrolase [Facklamia sp. 7083-14-GEN3]|uniref:class A beta-lactamase-related serine hydrolase n=1 Tax=Facklamia sp. 7083-14-GEN3 TaxID=2973478 RepID=UPI00215B8AD7|nr:class A beta-lactamase-related serine hydrolase [Facklamia sp. 7083-14-GEN3]MCR8969443.1 class A beta-lactamase-related serine hydrolase [Facklamia sp. 7083-14-GEN3]